jgi:hypothetical protein
MPIDTAWTESGKKEKLCSMGIKRQGENKEKDLSNSVKCFAVNI